MPKELYMKRILVLGSGFTAKPLVDYLYAQNDYHLTVTGLTVEEAQNVTKTAIIQQQWRSISWMMQPFQSK